MFRTAARFEKRQGRALRLGSVSEPEQTAMTFQIRALPYAPFARHFAMSDDELARHEAQRQIVCESPGTPCRVSLEDVAVGETVLLINHEHQPAASPYRSRHAVFVRHGAVEAHPEPGAVPDVLARRLLSVRVFDSAAMMVDADVVDGATLANWLEAAFENPATDSVHIHYAKPGCFAARATRAGKG